MVRGSVAEIIWGKVRARVLGMVQGKVRESTLRMFRERWSLLGLKK